MHRSIIGTKPKLLLYHGWLVVAAAFLIALYGFGIGFYGPGIYLGVLKELHGCPTRESSEARTTYTGIEATFVLFWDGLLSCRQRQRTVLEVETIAMPRCA